MYIRYIPIFVSVILIITLLVPALLIEKSINNKTLSRLLSIRNKQLLLVLGRSMEPTIRIGSILLVCNVKPKEVRAGDIIAFRISEKEQSASGEWPIATHRVTKILIKNNMRYFQTKGDASEDRDRQLVAQSELLGITSLSIPYIGYLVHFAKQQLGWFLCIIIPGFLVVAFEIRNILLQLNRTAKKTTEI